MALGWNGALVALPTQVYGPEMSQDPVDTTMSCGTTWSHSGEAFRSNPPGVNPDGAGKLWVTSPPCHRRCGDRALQRDSASHSNRQLGCHSLQRLSQDCTSPCPVTHSASPPPPHKLCRAPTEVTVSPPSTAHAERAHAVALT